MDEFLAINGEFVVFSKAFEFLERVQGNPLHLVENRIVGCVYLILSIAIPEHTKLVELLEKLVLVSRSVGSEELFLIDVESVCFASGNVTLSDSERVEVLVGGNYRSGGNLKGVTVFVEISLQLGLLGGSQVVFLELGEESVTGVSFYLVSLQVDFLQNSLGDVAERGLEGENFFGNRLSKYKGFYHYNYGK